MSHIAISLEADPDGFLSRECPTCSRQFKVLAAIANTDAVSHCPYCGHHGTDCWWSTAQVEYIHALQRQALNSAINTFQGQVRRLDRPGFRVTARSVSNPSPTAPLEPDHPSDRFTFTCCTVEIKHDSSTAPLRCVTCGVSSHD